MKHPDAIYEGDWRHLPESCPGTAEVWDQTIGCPECGMNLWNLPEHGHWPVWAVSSEPAADHWKTWEARGVNPYDPYMELFKEVHARGFQGPPWSRDPNSPPAERRDG